jgi:hypothetical protein
MIRATTRTLMIALSKQFHRWRLQLFWESTWSKTQGTSLRKCPCRMRKRIRTRMIGIDLCRRWEMVASSAALCARVEQRRPSARQAALQVAAAEAAVSPFSSAAITQTKSRTLRAGSRERRRPSGCRWTPTQRSSTSRSRTGWDCKVRKALTMRERTDSSDQVPSRARVNHKTKYVKYLNNQKQLSLR